MAVGDPRCLQVSREGRSRASSTRALREAGRQRSTPKMSPSRVVRGCVTRLGQTAVVRAGGPRVPAPELSSSRRGTGRVVRHGGRREGSCRTGVTIPVSHRVTEATTARTRCSATHRPRPAITATAMWLDSMVGVNAAPWWCSEVAVANNRWAMPWPIASCPTNIGRPAPARCEHSTPSRMHPLTSITMPLEEGSIPPPSPCAGNAAAPETAPTIAPRNRAARVDAVDMGRRIPCQVQLRCTPAGTVIDCMRR